jgi:hypothetical protein
MPQVEPMAHFAAATMETKFQSICSQYRQQMNNDAPTFEHPLTTVALLLQHFQPLLAAATLEWSLTASSPDFDNPQKAKADGSYGHWQLTIDQVRPTGTMTTHHY